MNRNYWYLASGLLYVALGVFCGWAYPSLPDNVPSHWNIAGEVDAYSDPLTSSLFIPLVAVGISSLMVIFARIEKNQHVADALLRMSTVMAGFMGALHVVTTAIALGYPVVLERALSGMMGVLFIIIGRMMYTIPPNGLFGIRTYWTLANPVVWTESHQLASRWMIGSGVVSIILALIPIRPVLLLSGLLTALLVAVAVPMVFAYRRFHQITDGQ
jgi:uncharacterized membrane protein